MKIAATIASMGPGGAERVLSLLVNAWAARGDDVCLITFEPAGRDFYQIDPAVRRIHIVAGRTRGVTAMIFQRAALLRKALRACSPSVAVGFVDTTNIQLIASSRGLNIPIIVSERTDPRVCNIRRPWQWARRTLYPLADGLVVQTEAVAEWAKRVVPEQRVHVIPNPVHPPTQASIARATDATADLKIVAIGRLIDYKGFDVLICAFAECVRAVPNAKLEIVGEGPQRQTLEAIAADLGVRDRVSMPGLIDSSADVLASADLFVLPSRFEGFPNVLLEAMAAGVAVIATDCPSGPGEILHNGIDGILVEPGNTAALARAMIELLGDSSRRSRLGNSARAVRDRFSIDAILRQWDCLFDRVGITAAH